VCVSVCLSRHEVLAIRLEVTTVSRRYGEIRIGDSAYILSLFAAEGSLVTIPEIRTNHNRSYCGISKSRCTLATGSRRHLRDIVIYHCRCSPCAVTPCLCACFGPSYDVTAPKLSRTEFGLVPAILGSPGWAGFAAWYCT
jgi:hypothetical protein